MPVVTIYGRPGCHLCEEAESRVRELLGDDAVTIEVVDIERDERLHRDLFELIPVIEVDGRRVGELGAYRRRTFAERLAEALNA
jgi:glutaredoxin